jgi:hypothetical protein
VTRNKLATPAALAAAVILLVTAVFLGWLVVRVAAVETLASQGARPGMLVAGRPTVVLAQAVGGLIIGRGKVDPATLPAVRRAAAALPLDARPYLLIASDYAQRGRRDLAIKSLEAGRRLDPRQRWIHILLLDRYLRDGKYVAAAEELSVLSRLVGGAQGPIATAMAQMSVAPETRDAVRETLRQDPVLERSVLTSLASSGTEPATLFAMASPSAVAMANVPGGWGTVLVDRLVEARRYAQARRVWQRINRLNDQQVAPLLYDAVLDRLPGSTPFNWTFNSGALAAVDVRGKKLEVNYYGRESGELANQLILLPPGTYRFGFVVSGMQPAATPKLAWVFSCQDAPKQTLASIPLQVGDSNPRRIAGTVIVPAGCPAQRLRLTGIADEFPAPISATIEGLRLDKVAAR